MSGGRGHKGGGERKGGLAWNNEKEEQEARQEGQVSKRVGADRREVVRQVELLTSSSAVVSAEVVEVGNRDHVVGVQRVAVAVRHAQAFSRLNYVHPTLPRSS